MLTGKPLTAKQQAVWDLRRPVEEGGLGKTITETAVMLGISQPVVSKYMVTIRKKLGITDAMARANIAKLTENKHPEVAAAAIEAAADPTAQSQKEAIERVNEELKRAGIGTKVSDALVRRMRVRYGNAITLKKQIGTNEILKTIEEEVHLISSYIDDKVVAEASLRDLALAKTALLEKRQLLKGEPTQIITDGDRKKLHEYLPSLMAEMQRRGITVEGQVTEKVVGP